MRNCGWSVYNTPALCTSGLQCTTCSCCSGLSILSTLNFSLVDYHCIKRKVTMAPHGSHRKCNTAVQHRAFGTTAQQCSYSATCKAYPSSHPLTGPMPGTLCNMALWGRPPVAKFVLVGQPGTLPGFSLTLKGVVFSFLFFLTKLGVLQGRCISYQPDWQPFPLLEVRADVVVVGPVPLMAIVKLARLVVKDAADMAAQGHYVQALVLQVCIAPAIEVQFTSLSVISSL